MLGLVHPSLRTAALPAELLNKRGRLVEVRIGGVVDAAQMQSMPDDDAAIRYLRLRTDLLARRESSEAPSIVETSAILQSSSARSASRP